MSERQQEIPPRASRVGGVNHVAAIVLTHSYRDLSTEASA